MKPKYCLIWLLSATLVGCGGTSVARSAKVPLDPLSHIKAKLAFTCVHEQIPASTAESDVLFQYARWLGLLGCGGTSVARPAKVSLDPLSQPLLMPLLALDAADQRSCRQRSYTPLR